LKGSPPFILKAANGTTQKVEGNTLPASSLTVDAVAFTDKTECPSFFCAYTGSDLYRDATHLCGHRTTDARNWEAYTRDSRDNQIYRITPFLDGKWWFVDDLLIAEKSVATCSSMTQYASSNPPNCPTNWRIPMFAE
jgi:hypothetical protein